MDKGGTKCHSGSILKTLIIFGTGSIKELGKEAAKLGHKAMIVTYPDIRRIGLLDKVVRDLKGKNIEVIVFEKVEPNPRTTTVDEGAEIARKGKIDLVIGLGGGSVMDAAKGIALASSGTAPIWDYWLNQAEVNRVCPSDHPGTDHCRYRFRDKSWRSPYELGDAY